MRACAAATAPPHLPLLKVTPALPLLSFFSLQQHSRPFPLSFSLKPLKNARPQLLSCRCAASAQCHVSNPPENDGFVVVNFYQFVFIENPHSEVSRHLSFLQGLDIRGRIYLNEQGINAQYSGPSSDALAYFEWLREDERFSNILVQVSSSSNGHAFPKLKLRYKPSLVQVEGGVSHLPLLDPSRRAVPLVPSEWRKKLEMTHDNENLSTGNRSFVLLDVRNGTASERGFLGCILGAFYLSKCLDPECYEWDIGHFQGAQRPDVECFRSTSFGLSQPQDTGKDPLDDIDKVKTDILMYCTGGIRCDVYSAILREKGFKNLYTLKGGISHYLKNEGPIEWVGNLFVFDSRLSLPPSSWKPEAVDETGRAEEASGENTSFARCYVCSSQLHELRHRNCANIDCNLLFLCCTKCMNNLSGCCCLNCTMAPRTRPLLPGNGRYEKWHIYRDMELQCNAKS